MLSPYGKTVAQGPSPGKPNRGMKAGPPVVRVLPRPPLGMSVRSHDWEPDRAYPYLSSPCLSARHAERKGKGRGLRAFIWPPVVARQGEGLRAYGTYIAKEFAMLVTDGFSAGARASSPAELPMCSGTPAGQRSAVCPGQPVRPPADARSPMLRLSRPLGRISRQFAVRRIDVRNLVENLVENPVERRPRLARSLRQGARLGARQGLLRRSRPFFAAKSARKPTRLRSVHHEGTRDVKSAS